MDFFIISACFGVTLVLVTITCLKCCRRNRSYGQNSTSDDVEAQNGNVTNENEGSSGGATRSSSVEILDESEGPDGQAGGLDDFASESEFDSEEAVSADAGYATSESSNTLLDMSSIEYDSQPDVGYDTLASTDTLFDIVDYDSESMESGPMNNKLTWDDILELNLEPDPVSEETRKYNTI